jgi:hypothetical protein
VVIRMADHARCCEHRRRIDPYVFTGDDCGESSPFTSTNQSNPYPAGKKAHDGAHATSVENAITWSHLYHGVHFTSDSSANLI